MEGRDTGEDRRETPADPLCRGSLPGMRFAGGRGTCARDMTLEAGTFAGDMTLEAGTIAIDMTLEAGAKLAGSSTLDKDASAPGFASCGLALGAAVPFPDGCLRLAPDEPARHGASPAPTFPWTVINGLLPADGIATSAEDEALL